MSTTDNVMHSELSENGTSSNEKVVKMTHVWTIDDINLCEANRVKIVSPEFSSYKNDKVIWLLSLDPNPTNCRDAISLWLHLSKRSEHKTVFGKVSFFMFNDEPKKEALMRSSSKIKKFVATDRDHSTAWGWNKFCEKGENFREKLLSNTVLKISCEIIFSTESENAVETHSFRNTPYRMPTNGADFLESANTDRDVTENLDTLLKTHLFADFVISVNGKDHPAHKAILAARSKVFAAMFQHDTKENQLNRIEIEDMSEETVSEMLRFIYTGRCENLDKLAGELLVAADKYDLNVLKTICSETLCANLTIENAAQNLIFADMHNADQFKIEVMKFIVTEPTKVFNTAGWKSVETNPLLVHEMFRAMARKLDSGAGGSSRLFEINL